MSANQKSSFLSGLWSRNSPAPPPPSVPKPIAEPPLGRVNGAQSSEQTPPPTQKISPSLEPASRSNAKPSGIKKSESKVRDKAKKTKTTKTEMRLVSYKGQRFAFKLEPVFWQILQCAADSKNKKIGAYIGPILASENKATNKTSTLRTHAAEWVCRQLADTARKVISPKTMESLAAAIPSPALAMNQEDQIVAQNHLFLDFLRNLVDDQDLSVLGTIRVKFARELSSIKALTQESAASFSNEKVIIQSSVGEWAANCRVLNIRSVQGSSLGLLIILTN